MCRPGHGFSRNLLTGGHIGPPLRGVGRCSGTNGNWRRTEAFPNGAGRSPPPTGGSGGACGGVWSPRPTGATLVVRSSGPMYLRHGFRRPNFVPKFGASVIGIGPYALRGDGGSARRVVVPYGWLRRVAAIARASGAQRSVCGADGRNGLESEQRSPPKGVINLGQSLSHGCAMPAPFAQGSLRGRGMRIAASLRSSQ